MTLRNAGYPQSSQKRVRVTLSAGAGSCSLKGKGEERPGAVWHHLLSCQVATQSFCTYLSG